MAAGSGCPSLMTEGAPSGGVAGGAPTEEWEEDERERVKESDAELTR